MILACFNVTAQPGRTGTRISRKKRITRKELIIQSSFQERIIRENRGICGIRVQVNWVEKMDLSNYVLTSFSY